jgi:hypothetical protein
VQSNIFQDILPNRIKVRKKRKDLSLLNSQDIKADGALKSILIIKLILFID